jgi:hypothetical protein
MELKRKQCENLLKRMAESMGLVLVAGPSVSIIDAHWYIAQRLRGYENKLTATYFSPADLLEEMLNYYQAFNLCGRVVDNPFFGMSPEEAELRLAVIGV